MCHLHNYTCLKLSTSHIYLFLCCSQLLVILIQTNVVSYSRCPSSSYYCSEALYIYIFLPIKSITFLVVFKDMALHQSQTNLKLNSINDRNHRDREYAFSATLLFNVTYITKPNRSFILILNYLLGPRT